jgi:hypothetical protein
MLNIIWQILLYSAVIVPFLGTITGAVYFKHLKKEYKYVAAFVTGSFVTQVLYLYFGYIAAAGFNLFMIPLYGIFEFAMFSLVFAVFFSSKNKKLFTLFVTLIALLLIFEGVYSFFNQNPAKFISYGKILVNLSIISYSVYYIINTLLDKSKKIIPGRIKLSFITLIYYVITLLLFIAINFLVNTKLQIVFYFWIFHAFVTSLFYVILTTILWKHGKSRKSLR